MILVSMYLYVIYVIQTLHIKELLLFLMNLNTYFQHKK